MIRFSDCALFRRGKGPNAMNSAEELWSRVLDMLKTDLTSTAIETWFTDCRALDANDSTLIISCPAEFKKNVIESRFLPFIRDSLREIFSGDFDVDSIEPRHYGTGNYGNGPGRYLCGPVQTKAGFYPGIFQDA